jgi:hypothetical protein
MIWKVKVFVIFGRLFKIRSFQIPQPYSARSSLCQGYELFLPVRQCTTTYISGLFIKEEIRQFFLTNSNEGEEQHELLLHCTVCWLSQGQFLERF